MKKYIYDYLIVGSGLFGSVFAQIMNENGKKCLVIDKRNHTGGNIYTKEESDIKIHWYGAHIFHTDNEEVWHYINNSIITLTPLWHTAKEGFTIFLLI